MAHVAFLLYLGKQAQWLLKAGRLVLDLLLCRRVLHRLNFKMT